MTRVLTIGLLLIIAAIVATYFRYQSLDPCDWMEQDLAAESDLPLIMLRAQIRAEFLLDGITEPGPADCISAWWDLRSNGLENSQ